MAAAQQAVQAAESLPTTLNLPSPLTTRPPTGKTVVFVQCDEDQCGLQASGTVAAAKVVGWKVKVLNFQSANPATLVSALNEALQYHPVAVYFSGLPYSLWSSVLPAYAKAGVIIVPEAVPYFTFSAVAPTDLAGNLYFERNGQLMAEEVTANSGGNAKVLLVSVPGYPIENYAADGFTTTLAHQCPGCKVVKSVEATIPELLQGQIVSLVVSALRSDPSIKYVVSVDGPFIQGLPESLKVAGLAGKISIVTSVASTSNEEDILNNTELSSTGEGLVQQGWFGVDAALRHLEGMSLPNYDEVLPDPLLTKANVGTPSSTGDVDVPSDYPSEFQKLWKET